MGTGVAGAVGTGVGSDPHPTTTSASILAAINRTEAVGVASRIKSPFAIDKSFLPIQSG